MRVNLHGLIDNAKCYEMVRQLRWDNQVECPHRHASEIDKNGLDEDGDGFCEIHVNTMEGLWSLLRSWLRPHRGVAQERLTEYVGFFQFMHNIRRRGNSLLRALVETLICVNPVQG